MSVALVSSLFFFFNDTATTEIYTFPYTTLFRSHTDRRNTHGGEGYWNRPGHDQFGGRRNGGWRPGRHPERGGRADHAVGRRVHEGWRAAGRPGGTPPGDHKSQEHGVLDQALHGPKELRGAGREDARPL